MREYFEEWIVFIRYHIFKFLQDREEAKRQSNEMKAQYPTPTVEEEEFYNVRRGMEDFEVKIKSSFTAEETFAERKSRIESGNVAYSDWKRK